MKWKILTGLFLLICAADLPAQNSIPDKAESFRLKDIKPGFPVSSLPFSSIRLMDYRFDTAKSGFANRLGTYVRLNVEGGMNAVETQLNKTFRNPAAPDSQSLTIVIRNLWLRDIKAGELQTDETLDHENISQCIVKFDCYAVSPNGYQALLRIDTIFSNKSALRNSANYLLNDAFNNVLKKISLLNVAELKKKKNSYPEEHIRKQYQQRIDKARAVPMKPDKGIYLSFEDFLNNRIYTKDFSIETTEISDQLYINQNGESKLFNDFWGFSEDGQYYIRIGTNFFPLMKDGDSFSFWGCYKSLHRGDTRSKDKVMKYFFFGVLSEIHSNRLKNFIHPMQVDMDTGNAY